MYPFSLIEHRPTTAYFHNLCSTSPPPRTVKGLLGLGLKFCPRPERTTNPIQFTAMADRFRRDMHTKFFFADEYTDEYNPKSLFIRSQWQPDTNHVPIEFRARVSHFLRRLKPLMSQNRRTPANLSLTQRAALRYLRTSNNHIVLPTDKNLGLAILEREMYIQRCYKDHLLDTATYQQLTSEEAIASMDTLKAKLKEFISTFRKHIEHNDRTFLTRSLAMDDPFSYFYAIAKVHKTPWKTRPIVSTSGSITHGLGRWLSQQLKPIVTALPSYVASSSKLVDLLKKQQFDPTRKISLFTCDATSMYTNICTDHALRVITTHLRLHKPVANIEAIINGLDILMRNNFFKFGDTYWHQLTGTAMGTPPAPDYATLYFGIHELSILRDFQQVLPFYRRYIDDGFGIWVHDNDPDRDQRLWDIFQDKMNSFGKLEWTFEPRCNQIPFLDLLISTRPKTGTIHYTLYEKALNLYQYLPLHSTHAPSNFRGFVIGMVTRIIRLTRTHQDRLTAVKKLYWRLIARGYNPTTVRKLFQDAFTRINQPRSRRRDTTPPAVYLHVPFHPHDITPHQIQHLFEDTVQHPPKEPPLSTLENMNGFQFGPHRLVVAYHRPHNLKNLLFPRQLREPEGKPCSVILTALKDA
mmetsp:Transcript_1627/g.3754  ORF Transcript_1627/g.3754 Transcript_1627/m.3754 type:complete len:636 (-) Transcript_1627:2757-4664(-)